MLAKKNIYLGLAILLSASFLLGGFFYLRQSKKISLQPEIKIAYGKVDKLTESSLSVANETFVDPENGSLPTGENGMKIKKFLIDKQTKFYRYKSQPLTDQDYNQQIADYNRQIDERTALGQVAVGLEPPNRFPLQSISAEEIKVGDEVEVYSIKQPQIDGSVSLSKVVVKQKTALANDPSKLSFKDTINGTIKELSPGKLILSVDKAELGTSTPDETRREVLLNGTEKFFKMTLRSPDIVLKEQQEFSQKINQLEQEGKSAVGLNPPALYDKQQAELKDLAEGQHVSVTLSYDGDKTSMIEITAIKE